MQRAAMFGLCLKVPSAPRPKKPCSSVGAQPSGCSWTRAKGALPGPERRRVGSRARGWLLWSLLMSAQLRPLFPPGPLPLLPPTPCSQPVSPQRPSVLGLPFSYLHLCKQSLYQILLTLPNWSVPSASCQDPDWTQTLFSGGNAIKLETGNKKLR